MSKPLAESPASVSIIDRQMIEASGAREIADLFRLVPGFIVGHFNGDKPVVTYHGLGNEFPRAMQVLVDGRSVFVPSFGGIPWSNLPLLLEDIERIEIIRGPNAVTYGANAFLATINIITRHAAEDFGARYSITASDNSNPDIKDAYLRLGFHHEDLDWRLSVGTSSDDGFANVNDSGDIDKINFRLDYLSGSNQSWTFQIGSSSSTSGTGEPNDFDDIERDIDATNSYLNILWERNSTHSVSSIRLTHTEQEVIDNFFADSGAGTIPRITGDIDFGRVSKRTDLEFIQSQEFGEDLRLVYGGSLRKDRVKSLFLLNDFNFHDVDTARLFTALEWRHGQNWLFDFGATLEDSSLTERESSPRLSIIRKLNPDHAFRFVASKAKRNPILFEHSGLTIFNADIIPFGNVDVQISEGNPNIEPENIVSYEFGLRSQFKDSRVSSDVKLFTYRISDHIVRAPTGNLNILGNSIVTTANQESTRVTGLDLALDFSPMSNLDIKSGFSFVDVESTKDDFEKSIPDKSAFINANYRWNSRHNFSASFYYIDAMQWLATPDINVIQPIRKLDLRYAYILDARSETRIELIGQNLLEDYNDYTLQNLAEPVFLLRVSGGF
ncbi:MAG: TonB-dependent receptor [Gammaproteobacteria bacterium]